MTTTLLDQRLNTILVSYDPERETLFRHDIATLKTLVDSVRSCSPYLNTLCDQWPDLIDRLKFETPEAIAQSLIEETKNITGHDGLDDGDFENTEFQYDQACLELRHLKQKMHLLCALCDIAKIWNWETIAAALSDFCDAAMQVLINGLAFEHGFSAKNLCLTPGLFVLAVGKYGGRELNYSSDIDIVIMYDPETISLNNPDKAERLLLRFVRKLIRGFDAYTQGYIFRTDLRLRPDPRSNSTVISTKTAARYYETLGQNWERAAMIKARFCGGDQIAAQDFIATVLTPFIWRRSLDYATIEDIHSIKRQIQGNASLGTLQTVGHDLKLGLGGIREIEFYTQVQQLILGGRNLSIRTPRTIDALSALSKGGYVDAEEAKNMIADYGILRDCEHRIQMHKDEQNHTWPSDLVTRKQITGLCGDDNVATIESKLRLTCMRIHQRYTDLFPREESLANSLGSLIFTGVEIEAQTQKTLTDLGFERTEMVWGRVSKWLGGRVRATRSPRARELATKLMPRFIEHCAQTGQADDAFLGLSQFIESLKAGVEVFSLLVNKPDAIKMLIEIIAITPLYAEKLAQQSELIAVMCEPDFLDGSIQMSKDMYCDQIKQHDDFETNINQLRSCVHEDQFKTAMAAIRGQSADKTAGQLSMIAQAAITAILPICKQEVERLYGKISGQYAVLAFGKLGSEEMTLRSDLDIILVYQPNSEENINRDDHRGDDPQAEFNKLTRRLITALSSVTSYGGLYEVDMNLRPSGRSGPLAVSLEAFERYYKKSAWTWEFMALSRVRILAASSLEFDRKLQNTIDQSIQEKTFLGELENDVINMHERILKEKPSSSIWDIKMVQGGIRFVDFIGQYILLKHKSFFAEKQRPISTKQILQCALEQNWIEAPDAKQLLAALHFYHSFSQIIAIITHHSSESILDIESLSRSKKSAILQALNFNEFSKMELQYAKWRSVCDVIFSKIFYPYIKGKF